MQKLGPKEIDIDIAKRLKYNHGSIDEFLDQRQVNKMIEEHTPIDEHFILGKIDPCGNLGKDARKHQDKRLKEKTKQVQAVQPIKRIHTELFQDPLEKIGRAHV